MLDPRGAGSPHGCAPVYTVGYIRVYRMISARVTLASARIRARPVHVHESLFHLCEGFPSQFETDCHCPDTQAHSSILDRPAGGARERQI